MNDVLILDQSSLRFRWDADRRTVAALTADGELLAVVTVDTARDERDAMFAACEDLLARGRVTRLLDEGGQVRYRLALYNPFTAQVALGPIPETRVFAGLGRLALPAAGAAARLTGEVLSLAAGELAELDPDPSAVSRSVAAHV